MKKAAILWIAILKSFCLADSSIQDISFSRAGDDSTFLIVKYSGDLVPRLNPGIGDSLVLYIERCQGVSQPPPVTLRHEKYIKKIQWRSIQNLFKMTVTFGIRPSCKVSMNRSELRFSFAAPDSNAVPSLAPFIRYSGDDPDYHACFGPVPETVVNNMAASRQAACPTDINDLAYLEISHWGTDDKKHRGAMIVHKLLAFEVLEIFSDLYTNKFPIEQMRLVDEFDGDDNLSMAANNTSAFNCRRSTGDHNRLSAHAFGTAIDINPLMNPYVNRTKTLPENGRKYKNRALKAKGLIRKNDACYQAFVKRGWIWGGSWERSKDYQHFEKNIRLN